MTSVDELDPVPEPPRFHLRRGGGYHVLRDVEPRHAPAGIALGERNGLVPRADPGDQHERVFGQGGFQQMTHRFVERGVPGIIFSTSAS